MDHHDPIASAIRDRANRKYESEVWTPVRLRPHAASTTRFDDIARLGEKERGRALDVGCGAGQLTLAMAERFDQVVGVDISDRRIQLAQSMLRERYPQSLERVRFQSLVPGTALPFPDRSFDVVIACAVLETVPDVFATMDEIARVCRPNGCLLASVANVCYLKHVAGLLMGKIPLTWSHRQEMAEWRSSGWDGGCVRYFSKDALSALLRHTGFAPEAWSGSGAWARYRRWAPNLVGSLTVRARRENHA